MNGKQNGYGIDKDTVARILNGEPVQLTAFDSDPKESAIRALRAVTQTFERGHVRTVTQPHQTKPGCTIVLHLGSLPEERREEMANVLKASTLKFEVVDTS